MELKDLFTLKVGQKEKGNSHVDMLPLPSSTFQIQLSAKSSQQEMFFLSGYCIQMRGTWQMKEKPGFVALLLIVLSWVIQVCPA